MLNGNVTWELVALLVAAVGGGVGVWLRIEGRIQIAAKALEARINKVEADATKAEGKVAELKIEVMQNDASVGHLEMVEDRLIKAITELTTEVKHLRDAWVGRPSSRRTTKG